MSDINDKIQQIALRVLPKIMKTVIWRDKNNFVLYNNYVVRRTRRGHTVSVLTSSIVNNFSELRTAVTWSTLHNNLLLIDAHRVKELDILLSGSLTQQQYLTRRLSKCKLQDYAIIISKLDRERVRSQQFKLELDKYITKAWDRQRQGWENEIKRSQRN